jgi:hypothetical protein
MSRTRIVAALGVAVLALAACQQGSTASPSAASAAPVTSTEPSASASAAASGSPSASFAQLFPVFQARGGSELTGGAIVTDVEDGSSVVIGIVLPGATESFPAALVEGDCASIQDPGPTPPAGYIPEPSVEPSGSAVAPSVEPSAAAPSPSAEPSPSGSMSAELPLWLTPIAVGSSNSVIPLTTSDLTAAPHAIVIEMGATDPMIIACADLQEGAPTPPSPAGSAPATSPEASGAAGSPEASPSSS